jgi:Succinate dehydrogenase/Fumarate reductase transmembrane subunit
MPLTSVLSFSPGTITGDRTEAHLPHHPHSSIQTQSLKPDEAAAILNTQRLARPSSPHFTIYQPQLTWIASIANRITGAGLSVRASGPLLSIYLLTPRPTFSALRFLPCLSRCSFHL